MTQSARAQLDFRRRQGCDQIQGYRLSRPLAADSLAAWIVARETEGAVAG